MHLFSSFFILLGRLCLGVIFILAGYDKFVHPTETAAYMASKGMTMVPFFLYAAACVELIGGLSLVLGYKTHWGATLLTLFLIAVTVIFYDFWNADAASKLVQTQNFIKSVGIIGGLLYAVGCGAGSFSVDHLCKCNVKKPD